MIHPKKLLQVAVYLQNQHNFNLHHQTTRENVINNFISFINYIVILFIYNAIYFFNGDFNMQSIVNTEESEFC